MINHYKMIVLVVVSLIIYLTYRYSTDYAEGMARYAKYNNVYPYRERTIDSIYNEWAELMEAIRSRSPINILFESFDVFHSLIKHLIISLLPVSIYIKPHIWYFIFPLVLPCGIKLSLRQKRYGCIRNHRNISNRDHRCNYGTSLDIDIKTE